MNGDLGGRAVRALLGEPDVAGIGIWKSNPRLPKDRRIGPIEDLLGYDVLVTDDPVVGPMLNDAIDARVPLVVAQDDVDRAAVAEALIDAQIPGLIGANIRSGLVHAVVAELRNGFDEVLEASVAWTELGRPLRAGHPIQYPPPTGPLWSKAAHKEWFPQAAVKARRYRSPVEGQWAALSITMSGFVNDGVVSRTVGASDDRDYLSAIALAAGAVAMARQVLPAGMWWAGDFASPYLDAARSLGFATASFEKTRVGIPAT